MTGPIESHYAWLAAVPQPAFVCDLRGKILSSNRQAELVHRRGIGEMNGQLLTTIGTARPGLRFLADDGDFAQVIGQLSPGQEYTYQAWHPRGDLSRFPATISIRPFEVPQREYSLAIIHDEQTAEGQMARMRMALDDSESVGRLKSEVLSRAGHDLRTPLTAIIGFCDLLLLDHPAESELGQVLARMRHSGSELDRQFARLIEFYKLMDGVLPIDVIEVSPSQVVRDACRRWHAHVTIAKLEFRQAIDDSVDRLRVAGDPRRMASILDELMSNAVAATEHGCIEIGATRNGQEVVFFVKDRGHGFPFYGPHGLRAPPAAGEAGEGRSGLGIGLPMARRLAAAQGGMLTMADSGPQGSRVELSLPIYTK